MVVLVHWGYKCHMQLAKNWKNSAAMAPSSKTLPPIVFFNVETLCVWLWPKALFSCFNVLDGFLATSWQIPSKYVFCFYLSDSTLWHIPQYFEGFQVISTSSFTVLFTIVISILSTSSVIQGFEHSLTLTFLTGTCLLTTAQNIDFQYSHSHTYCW